MLGFILLIPLIFVVFLIIFFHEKVIWWEYIILIVPSFIVTVGIYFGMVSYSSTDTEYLGDYVTEVRYYEPWNEYIHKTCYHEYTTGSGNNKVTHKVPYDCSYVDYHNAKWTQVVSAGTEYDITQSEYNRLISTWATKPIAFIEMNRNYHTIDGDAYKKEYDGIREHSKTRTITHNYKNKIRSSHSIFGFTSVKTEDAKRMGLYNYPKLTRQSGLGIWESGLDQSPFLGYEPTKNELLRWQFINGYYGPTKQFRVYVLFFYNQSQSIVQDQRDYWEGGNKNEMVLCIGLDSISKKVQWSDAFSWCDKPTFEVNFRSFMSGKDTVNLIELADFTEHGAVNYWSRKEFKDFDYINVELTRTQLLWLIMIIILLNAGLSTFIVLNDINHDSKNY